MEVYEEALISAGHREPDRVPLVLLSYGLVLKGYPLSLEKDYYHNPRLQIEAKIAFQKRFPGVWNLYHGAPEHGDLVSLPTIFGGELAWPKDDPPWVSKYPIQDAEDVDRLVEQGAPDPQESPVVRTYLDYLQYYYDWFPRDMREKYGYLDHQVNGPFGPIEGAALCVGYEKFLVWMRREPSTVKRLLDIATETYIRFIEAVEEVVGDCRLLFVPDHMAAQVRKEEMKEFIVPYLNKIFQRYNKALRIWHNEGSITRDGKVLDRLEVVDKIKAEVWHFGWFDDPAICKEKTHFCLMGNLHPPGIMLKGSPGEISDASKDIISKAGEGGGLWLSTGGGMAPGTPFRNIDAMITAIERFGGYK